MRNALAHAGKTQRRIVSAWIGTAFAQDEPSLESPTYTRLRQQHLRILRVSSLEHKWVNYYER
jgi:hypothetical protein